MTNSYKHWTGGIKAWKEEERPREKLLAQGADQLTLAELLGILINAGHQEVTAVALAQEILRAVEYDLHALSTWQAPDFQAFKGIGPAKAVTLVAALELTRRRAQQNFKRQSVLTDSQSTYQYLKGILGDLDHEEFWVLCLNQANRLITARLISKGGIVGTVVDSRIVFRLAINTPRCVSIILAHNHPSGQLRPSQADIQLTQKMVKGAKSLDLRVLDHLIVGQSGYFSFMDEQLL
ncbi:MAG: DNA repair protein RadC [Bacteroidota bacterium]